MLKYHCIQAYLKLANYVTQYKIRMWMIYEWLTLAPWFSGGGGGKCCFYFKIKTHLNSNYLRMLVPCFIEIHTVVQRKSWRCAKRQRTLVIWKICQFSTQIYEIFRWIFLYAWIYTVYMYMYVCIHCFDIETFTTDFFHTHA